MTIKETLLAFICACGNNEAPPQNVDDPIHGKDGDSSYVDDGQNGEAGQKGGNGGNGGHSSTGRGGDGGNGGDAQ